MYKKLVLTLLFVSLNAQNVVNSDKIVQKAKEGLKAANTNLGANSTTAAPKKLTIEQATIKAINEARSKTQICGKPAPPLRWNQSLYNVTKEHTIDMAVNKMLSHEGSGTMTDVTAINLKLGRGSHFYERVNQEKDSKKYLSGELVIRTDLNSLKTPKDLINYWISRPKDCQTIMNPKFTDVALAKVISNKEKKAYWTLMLMGPKRAK